MTFWKQWLVIIFGLLPSASAAQIIDVTAGSMTNALTQIEAASDYLINYNPCLLYTSDAADD